MTERAGASALTLGLFAGACLAGAELGHVLSLSLHGWASAMVWPPGGLLLVALVLHDRREWNAWLLAACVAMVLSDRWHDVRLIASLGTCAARCLEAVLGARLLCLVVDEPFTMQRVRDLWAFSVAALVATMVGAVAGAGLLWTLATGPSFWEAWRSWALGDFLGVVLWAPPAFAWQSDRAHIIRLARSWRLAEVIVVLAGIIAVTQGVYGDLLPPLLRVPAYLLPFLLWSAFRFGPGGASATVLAACLVGMWNSGHGKGPYTEPGSPVGQSVLRGQATSGVMGLSILLLAGVIAERKRTAHERTILVADLQQALAEIRTLQGMIPMCAWCHKIRDDAGFWQKIETYLQDHTDATFSHGICSDCTDDIDATHPKWEDLDAR